jgi:hypothetical protein
MSQRLRRQRLKLLEPKRKTKQNPWGIRFTLDAPFSCLVDPKTISMPSRSKPIAAMSLIGGFINAASSYLLIKANRANYDLWKESIYEEEELQNVVMSAIRDSESEHVVSALKRRLQIQAQISRGLESRLAGGADRK